MLNKVRAIMLNEIRAIILEKQILMYARWLKGGDDWGQQREKSNQAHAVVRRKFPEHQSRKSNAHMESMESKMRWHTVLLDPSQLSVMDI